MACAAFLALASMAVVSGSAADKEGHCDPYLNTSGNHPFGYRLRGDRCEGIYVQDVASTPLEVVSFTEPAIRAALAAGSGADLAWASPAGQAIRLRAQGLRARVYYRMDSLRPPGSSSYRWPSDVLSAVGITGQEIGVVAWTGQTIANRKQRLYLPLGIRGQTSEGQRTYELVLMPGSELQEVFVTLATVVDGKTGKLLRDGKPLGHGYYPAGRGITVPLGPLPAAGTYFVEIGATLRGRGAATLELFFFHGTPVAEAKG